MPYSQTIEVKLNDIKELYKGLSSPPANFKELEIIPSPMPFGYRTRCQLHIVKGKAGFHKRRSHELIEIERCEVLDERLNKKIKELRFPSNFDGKIELYIKDGIVCETDISTCIKNLQNNAFWRKNPSGAVS